MLYNIIVLCNTEHKNIYIDDVCPAGKLGYTLPVCAFV